jgi:hypothetical protein
VIQSFAFIASGVLVYLLAGWLARFYSDRTDNWERDGVIRHGALSRKVWKEDEPEKFASRIDNERFVATAVHWFLKIFGAIFAIGGVAQLMGIVAT